MLKKKKKKSIKKTKQKNRGLTLLTFTLAKMEGRMDLPVLAGTPNLWRAF